MVSETSAMLNDLRASEPLKITSAISPPRSALGRLFAQHPADGVGDVGFAATIGANDGRDPRLKIQRSPVGKRFKSQNR